jgi:hypothetical protein
VRIPVRARQLITRVGRALGRPLPIRGS